MIIFLDILSEIYRVISEHSTKKNDITDALTSVTIRCRYIISDLSNQSSPFKSHDTYNITFKDLSNINHDSIISDMTNIISSTTLSSSADKNKTALNDLINTYFKPELLNHIKYIKKADMIYATHFENFYKLCRLMLNYNILYCIQYLVAVNVKNISTVSGSTITYNDISTEFIEFKTNNTDIINIADYRSYDKHIRPKSLLNTFTTYYNYTDISTNENVAIGANFNKTEITTNYNTVTYINNISNVNSDKIYRIISINKSDNFMSKPCGKIISYKINGITLIMDFGAKKISSIENVVPNEEYFIKLHNFSTKFTVSDATNGDATTLPKIKWYNQTKILHILKSNQEATINISSLNIYIINFVTAVAGAGGTPATFDISSQFNTAGDKFSILIPSQYTTGVTGITVNNFGLATIALQESVRVPLPDTGVVNAIISQDNVFKYIMPLISQDGRYIINNVKSLSLKDIDDEIILGLVCHYAKTIAGNSDTTFNDINKFYIDTASSFNGISNYPRIGPVSFEKDTHLAKITKTDNTSVTYINDYYYQILLNFKENIENFKLESTDDTDTIITNMRELEKINGDLNKNSSDLKKNYSNFKDENTKVLSSNTLDIIVIILFVITLFSALYIPLTSFNKNTKIIMAGGLFCLVLIVFIIIYIIIYAQYNELFSNSSIHKINSTPISNKFKDIITVLKNNFFNTRIRISQKIILPAIKNEKIYFEDKNKKFDIYKSISLSDYRIQKRTRLNNINRITFFLHITLIIATALILYILLPEYWQIILGIFIILIILSLLLYYIKLVNIVHTNPNNIYWFKPETSLKGL